MQRSHYGLMVFITAFPRSLVWITLASIQLSEHGVGADDITRVSVSPLKCSSMSSVQLEWSYTDNSNKVNHANLLYGTSVNDAGFIVNSSTICSIYPTGSVYHNKERYLGRVSFKWSSLHITVNISDVTVNDTGYYSLLMKSSSFQPIPGLTSKGIQVIIQGTPPIQTTIKSDDNNVTSGTDVTLTCTTISYFETNFTFYFNDDPLTTNQNGVLEIKNFNQSNEGNYTCQASNTFGSDSSNILYLNVNTAATDTGMTKEQSWFDKILQNDEILYPIIGGACFLVILIIIFIILCCIRRKRRSSRKDDDEESEGSESGHVSGSIKKDDGKYEVVRNSSSKTSGFNESVRTVTTDSSDHEVDDNNGCVSLSYESVDLSKVRSMQGKMMDEKSLIKPVEGADERMRNSRKIKTEAQTYAVVEENRRGNVSKKRNSGVKQPSENGNLSKINSEITKSETDYHPYVSINNDLTNSGLNDSIINPNKVTNASPPSRVDSSTQPYCEVDNQASSKPITVTYESVGLPNTSVPGHHSMFNPYSRIDEDDENIGIPAYEMVKPKRLNSCETVTSPSSDVTPAFPVYAEAGKSEKQKKDTHSSINEVPAYESVEVRKDKPKRSRTSSSGAVLTSAPKHIDGNSDISSNQLSTSIPEYAAVDMTKKKIKKSSGNNTPGDQEQEEENSVFNADDVFGEPPVIPPAIPLPLYAVVDKSKKTRKKSDINESDTSKTMNNQMPEYAVVDKSKKKKMFFSKSKTEEEDDEIDNKDTSKIKDPRQSLSEIPAYAQVDMSKKTKRQSKNVDAGDDKELVHTTHQSDSMPLYAVVDKSKKTRNKSNIDELADTSKNINNEIPQYAVVDKSKKKKKLLRKSKTEEDDETDISETIKDPKQSASEMPAYAQVDMSKKTKRQSKNVETVEIEKDIDKNSKKNKSKKKGKEDRSAGDVKETQTENSQEEVHESKDSSAIEQLDNESKRNSESKDNTQPATVEKPKKKKWFGKTTKDAKTDHDNTSNTEIDCKTEKGKTDDLESPGHESSSVDTGIQDGIPAYAEVEVTKKVNDSNSVAVKTNQNPPLSYAQLADMGPGPKPIRNPSEYARVDHEAVLPYEIDYSLPTYMNTQDWVKPAMPKKITEKI